MCQLQLMLTSAFSLLVSSTHPTLAIVECAAPSLDPSDEYTLTCSPLFVPHRLLRILMDEEDEDGEGLSFDRAFKIVSKVFSYTNHTVLPEVRESPRPMTTRIVTNRTCLFQALEKWPVPLLQNLLPRHMDLIYMINLDFLQAVEKLFPGDVARLGRMSLIEEGFPKMVRMAHLAVIGSHKARPITLRHITISVSNDRQS